MNLSYGNINKFAKLATPMPKGIVDTLPAENEKSLAYGKIATLLQRPKMQPNNNNKNKPEHELEHKAEKELANSMVQHTLLHGLGLSHFAIFLEIGEKITDTFSEMREMKKLAQNADNEIALGNQKNLDFNKKLTYAMKSQNDDDDNKNKKKKQVSYNFGRMKM